MEGNAKRANGTVRRRRLLGGLLVGLMGLIGIGAGAGLGTWSGICHDCPSIAQMHVWEPKQSTKLYSHDGRLIAELAEERRTPILVSELPAHVPQAFLAVEDRRFYDHHGLDYRGIARAARDMLARRRIAGGGSTLTQQLARNMFAELGFERSWSRKLKEARVALELERVYSKDQILEAYINQINFGHGWYGIETAAQRYFGKAAAEINPAEAAMLAGLPRRPQYYSPLANPDQAESRRNLVLSLMVREGFLTREEARHWQAKPLPERRHEEGEGEIGPYFVEWVRDQLYGRYGTDLYQRGFQVYTSLDVDMQRRAEEVMVAAWDHIEAQPGYRHPKPGDPLPAGRVLRGNETPYLQGMFVAMDLETGDIRAMVGGRDFNESKFNRAVQARRQTGSVFKPVVFAAAIAGGIPPSHVIFDSPVVYEEPDGDEWSPRNFGGAFQGPTTLRHALNRSINVVAVKLGNEEVGLETVIQMARRLGISSRIPRVPSVPIGSAESTPLEMIEAYSAFATEGERVRPRPILRIEDAEGRLLWESRTERSQVIDTLTAAVVRDMLRSVVDNGTGFSIRNPEVGALPYTIPAAGKTGTTNDFTDIWFVGFTPDIMAGVWFGMDFPATVLPDAQASRFAAPVWADFMRTVYVEEPVLREMPTPWDVPSELITRLVDRETGKLATELCPDSLVYAELFIPGTEPTEPCDLHRSRLFDRPAPLRQLPPDTLPGN